MNKLLNKPLGCRLFEKQSRSYHDDVIKWKHFPRNWPFVNSHHKGQWRGALMFSLFCVWINGWVNNGEAGDLRRNRGHYVVIVMFGPIFFCHGSEKSESPFGARTSITYLASTMMFNPFWSNEAILRRISCLRSTHVMVLCLTAPKHHLNQYWASIPRYKPRRNLIEGAHI